MRSSARWPDDLASPTSSPRANGRGVDPDLYGVTRAAGSAAPASRCPNSTSSGRRGASRCRHRSRRAAAASRTCVTIRSAIPSRRLPAELSCFSDTIDRFGYADCPPHPTWLEPAEWLGSRPRRPLPVAPGQQPAAHTLARPVRQRRVSHASKVATREPIGLHPEDAAARGIAAGDIVRVFNDRGACLAGAVISDGVRPGVVQLATGAWFDPVEPGTSGTLERHGNPNVLTLDIGTSQLAQGPSALTALVEVELARAERLPAVRAFVPPPIDDGRCGATHRP